MADGDGRRTAATPAPFARTGLVHWLARRRVALGFVTTMAALWLSRPTWTTWRLGFAVAIAGEALRVWAAGHLEKGREVTRSGPYRFTRHPLYVGSSLIALGAIVAANNLVVALLGGIYMGTTIMAAVRSEEAELERAFGSAYGDYRAARAAPMARQFSAARAIRNREHRAVLGLLGGFALLALKIAFG
jgi:protein-S-isoprenylcysteine O-methyltransferase Ste14